MNDYALTKTSAQSNARHLGQPSAVAAPRECVANEVKQQLRELASIVAENTRRCEQIAARLGHYPPKSDQNAATPVPNGHLDEMRQMIAAINDATVEAAGYLNAIERQV
jgi:phosphohistidine phosphatase SixA